MKLTTERFLIRNLRISDATNTYLNWLYSEKENQFISRTFDKKNINFLKNFIKEVNLGHDINYENHTTTLGKENVKKLKNSYKQKKVRTEFLGIFEKKEFIHIGNIKYDPIDLNNKFAIMGILIGNKKYRGKGTFKEVFTETCKKINTKYKIKKIFLGLGKDNMIAKKAYEKVGFKVYKNNNTSIFMSINLPLFIQD